MVMNIAPPRRRRPPKDNKTQCGRTTTAAVNVVEHNVAANRMMGAALSMRGGKAHTHTRARDRRNSENKKHEQQQQQQQQQ
jgi:hypothetical protein